MISPDFVNFLVFSGIVFWGWVAGRVMIWVMDRF